jgi:hypothetical protein
MVKTCRVISDLLILGWNFAGNFDSASRIWSIDGERRRVANSLFSLKKEKRISRQKEETDNRKELRNGRRG